MSVIRLMNTPESARLVVGNQVGDAMVDRARSILATRFLDSNCDVLLSVDSDIVFEPADAFQVADQAAEFGIVCGIYLTRNPERRPVPATHFELNTPLLLGGTDPTPVPVRWPAGGFVAVAREVFEAVKGHAELPLCNPKNTPFYPFYAPFWVEHEDAGMVYLSEDWAFAERARRAGFPSYANPAVRLQHWGTYAFQNGDALRDETPTCPIEMTRTAAKTYHARAVVPAGAPA